MGVFCSSLLLLRRFEEEQIRIQSSQNEMLISFWEDVEKTVSSNLFLWELLLLLWKTSWVMRRRFNLRLGASIFFSKTTLSKCESFCENWGSFFKFCCVHQPFLLPYFKMCVKMCGNTSYNLVWWGQPRIWETHLFTYTLALLSAASELEVILCGKSDLSPSTFSQTGLHPRLALICVTRGISGFFTWRFHVTGHSSTLDGAVTSFYGTSH